MQKEKQGIATALTSPEDDESQIREKVFDQSPVDDLKSVNVLDVLLYFLNGLDVLLIFLDQHLQKDDLSDSLEKFEDCEDFCRSQGQSLTEDTAVLTI